MPTVAQITHSRVEATTTDSMTASTAAKRTLVVVTDRMQRNYRHRCTEPAGKNFVPDFAPELIPKQMLALGVFGGRYMTDCTGEFPAD